MVDVAEKYPTEAFFVQMSVNGGRFEFIRCFASPALVEMAVMELVHDWQPEEVPVIPTDILDLIKDPEEALKALTNPAMRRKIMDVVQYFGGVE